MKIQSVCLLAVNLDNKVLAVSRRGTTDQWGLVGGKVDPGETDLEALLREVYEETKIVIHPRHCKEIFNRECGNYIVRTYLYNFSIKKNPVQGDAGSVGWVTWDDLIKGPFGEYNQKLKEIYDFTWGNYCKITNCFTTNSIKGFGVLI